MTACQIFCILVIRLSLSKKLICLVNTMCKFFSPSAACGGERGKWIGDYLPPGRVPQTPSGAAAHMRGLKRFLAACGGGRGEGETGDTPDPGRGLRPLHPLKSALIGLRPLHPCFMTGYRTSIMMNQARSLDNPSVYPTNFARRFFFRFSRSIH